jgi:hypothetical protein
MEILAKNSHKLATEPNRSKKRAEENRRVTEDSYFVTNPGLFGYFVPVTFG